MNYNSEVVLLPPKARMVSQLSSDKMAPSVVDSLPEKSDSVSCYQSKPASSLG